MRSQSLQRRLLVLLLGSVITVWVIVGSIIQQEVRHEAEEVFDANLVQTAKLLLTLVEGELREAPQHRWHLITPYQLDEIGQQFHHYEHKVAFQVTDLEGNLILQSYQAPEQLLTTEVGSFQTRLLGGKVWRTFSLSHPLATIHVGESIEVRNEVAEEVTEHLLEYALLSLPLLALLIWWSVRRGLHPIRRITRDLTQRDSHHLTEMELSTTPVELVPLVNALNLLFSRLQRSMDKERRFTADAAHELRTPLAAIKVHAQVAHNEEDSTRRAHALEKIIQGVDRTTHLAEQLLSLARIDSIQQLELSQNPVHLQQVIGDNIDLLQSQATHADITLENTTPDTQCTVTGNRELISTLLRNLIDNAIRYTPKGGKISITLESQPEQCQLSIRDTGPGIPPEIQERIFERFYRNSNTASGSGLGLSISQRIAEIHHSSIQLQNCSSPAGLEVKLHLKKT